MDELIERIADKSAKEAIRILVAEIEKLKSELRHQESNGMARSSQRSAAAS